MTPRLIPSYMQTSLSCLVQNCKKNASSGHIDPTSELPKKHLKLRTYQLKQLESREPLQVLGVVRPNVDS